MKSMLHDPRHFQIMTLSFLMLLQMFWADFGPTTLIAILTLSSVMITQITFSKIFKIKFDARSPFITALSLTILLKSSMFWIIPLAGVVAISSKFLIRFNAKHIFNPANFGIVVMLLILPNTVWVSPAQWGSALWLAVVLVCLALLVLFKIPRRDMAPIFLTLWAVTLFARALWLGDPLTIPMHQLQNGALLIFAFFMISDPKTIPDRLIGRYIFALAVCALSYIMIFEFRLREGLFYALAIVSIIRPLIDFMFKSEAFQWRKPITGEIL